MIIPYNIIIIQFLIKNPIIIQGIINKLNIDHFFLPVYKIIIKNYIKYQSFITLIRNLQINKLKQIAANRKKRSKRIIKYIIINPEKWETIKKARKNYNAIKKKRSITLRARSRLRQRRKLKLKYKKITNTANRAANKIAKKAETTKKNN
jgi:hypothetical protein